MSNLGTLALIAWLSVLVPSSSTYAENLGDLESLQEQVAQTISNSSKAGAALEGLEYIRGKFFPTIQGSGAVWEVSSKDALGSLKPRIMVKGISGTPQEVRVTKWVLREEKNAQGVCVPLKVPVLSSVSPTDCPSRNTELVIDESGLAGVESLGGITQEEEQQGVVGVLDLSDEERKVFLTDPAFKPNRLTSGIKSLRVVFKKIIEEKDSKFLELEVAGVMARIRLPHSNHLDYVESGTGRILSVSLPQIESRSLASVSCPVVTHTEKGCTGLGSASCSSPQPTLGKPFHRFCKPQVGNLGNFIVSQFGKGDNRFFLANSGQVFSSSGALPQVIERKFVSVVGPNNGEWFALRSDGAVFRTSDIESPDKFQRVTCLSLERAEALVPEQNSELSCL